MRPSLAHLRPVPEIPPLAFSDNVVRDWLSGVVRDGAPDVRYVWTPTPR
jgi:hypothetical protein